MAAEAGYPPVLSALTPAERNERAARQPSILEADIAYLRRIL